MSYDGEQELMKAKLGLKFRCIICGRTHDPTKNVWEKCFKRAKEMYKIFDKTCFDTINLRKYRITKGTEVVKKLSDRYCFEIKIYDSDFELLTIPKKVQERYRRALEWCKAGIAVLKKELNKLPDIPTIVNNATHGKYGEFDKLVINGNEYDASEILEYIFCSPTGSWSSSNISGKYFSATNYSIYKVDKNLKYALVQRRDSQYKKGHLIGLKKSYYLASRKGYVEIPANLRTLSNMTIEEIVERWGKDV